MSTATSTRPATPPSIVQERYAQSTIRHISALQITARAMEADLPRKVAHVLDVWERVARRILESGLPVEAAYTVQVVHASRTLARIAQLEAETAEGVAALRAKAARLDAGRVGGDVAEGGAS